MDDFFKQFRDNLENRPAPQYREDDWRRMEHVLDDQTKKRGIVFAWWWIAIPLLALLLIGNLLFYQQLKKTQHALANLEDKTDTIYTKFIHLTDTIYKTTLIYHTDTIFISNQSSRQILSHWSDSRPGSSQMPGLQTFSSINRNKGQDHLLFQKTDLNSPAAFEPEILNIQKNLSEDHTTGQPAEENRWDELDFLDINLPRPFIYQREYFALSAFTPAFSKKKKSFNDYLEVIRPKGYVVGIHGGWAKPTNTEITQKSGIGIGLTSAIAFSRNFQLWFDADYYRMPFESTIVDDANGIPAVTPPSPDFIFKKVEFTQPLMQYTIGLQYLFQTNSRWYPKIGIGYAGVSQLPYELVYDFINPTLEVEWSLDKSVGNSGLLTNYIVFRGGLEFDITQRWSYYMDAKYRTPLGHSELMSARGISITGGIMYRF